MHLAEPSPIIIIIILKKSQRSPAWFVELVYSAAPFRQTQRVVWSESKTWVKKLKHGKSRKHKGWSPLQKLNSSPGSARRSLQFHSLYLSLDNLIRVFLSYLVIVCLEFCFLLFCILRFLLEICSTINLIGNFNFSQILDFLWLP